MYKLRSLLQRYRVSSTLLLILAMMLITITVRGAYRVQRPITDGKIHQWNLYGENDNDYPTYPGGHKGIDFPAVLGTDVYAIANGTIMDKRETVDNGTGTGFGNYVLVRHTTGHYVRHNNGQMIGQWGYVYSIYAHLSKNSVSVEVGDTVTTGQKIAEVDDTGNSGGNHLHLQIVLDPSRDRNNGADYDWTETHSRNPEIWLPPYDNGSTQTATAIGKVTDANGNPVGGLQIHGMQKPDDAIWNPSQYPYGWSETYNANTENPDDILVENFATTDVAPGTYHVEAKYSNGTLYKDLGWHAFVAGQTTYVGLYPVYLPDIRRTTDGWVSNIVIRNNSGTDTAQVNTTFFGVTGSVADQRTNSIGPQDTVVLNPPAGSFSGSAVVVASQDVAVVVENLKSGEATNYQGITPAAGNGNAGWGQAGQPVYVPIFKHAWYGRSGDLYVQNVGNAPAHVDLTLYQSLPEDNAGTAFHDPTWQRTVDINGRTIYRATQLLGLPTGRVYAARLTSDQPLAVVTVEHQSDGTNQASANGFSSGALTGYVPLVKKNWYPTNNTGTSVQNLNGYTSTMVNYYQEDDTPTPYDPSTGWQGLPAYTTRVYYSPNYLPSANNYLGSAIVHSSSSPAAVLVHEAGNGMYLMHDGFLAGTNTVILPRIYKPDPNKSMVPWTTGIQVQNVGGAPANVTIQYYDQNGNPAATDGDSIASNRAQVFWQGDTSDPLPSPFVGSAVITSDQPIVAIVNVSRDGSGDTGMSYSGFNR